MKTAIKTNGIPATKITNHYTDIKTFEDACAFLGIDTGAYSDEIKQLPADVYAYMQLRIISQALNGRFICDYSDTHTPKYYPLFAAANALHGFEYWDVASTQALSVISSRVLYRTKEIAEHAGKQFVSIYDQYINQ